MIGFIIFSKKLKFWNACFLYWDVVISRPQESLNLSIWNADKDPGSLLWTPVKSKFFQALSLLNLWNTLLSFFYMRYYSTLFKVEFVTETLETISSYPTFQTTQLPNINFLDIYISPICELIILVTRCCNISEKLC